MGDSDSGYQFGTVIDDEELARLEAQGAALARATRMIFTAAGIQPGMRVLDLASVVQLEPVRRAVAVGVDADDYPAVV